MSMAPATSGAPGAKKMSFPWSMPHATRLAGYNRRCATGRAVNRRPVAPDVRGMRVRPAVRRAGVSNGRKPAQIVPANCSVGEVLASRSGGRPTAARHRTSTTGGFPMTCKSVVALAAILLRANVATAGEMDNDRPGTAVRSTAPQAAGSELDRESPAQACFFFQPWCGWCSPWGLGLGFSDIYTINFFSQPFFPAYFAPYWGWWGFGFNPDLIWY